MIVFAGKTVGVADAVAGHASGIAIAFSVGEDSADRAGGAVILAAAITGGAGIVALVADAIINVGTIETAGTISGGRATAGSA